MRALRSRFNRLGGKNLWSGSPSSRSFAPFQWSRRQDWDTPLRDRDNQSRSSRWNDTRECDVDADFDVTWKGQWHESGHKTCKLTIDDGKTPRQIFSYVSKFGTPGGRPNFTLADKQNEGDSGNTNEGPTWMVRRGRRDRDWTVDRTNNNTNRTLDDVEWTDDGTTTTDIDRDSLGDYRGVDEYGRGLDQRPWEFPQQRGNGWSEMNPTEGWNGNGNGYGNGWSPRGGVEPRWVRDIDEFGNEVWRKLWVKVDPWMDWNYWNNTNNNNTNNTDEGDDWITPDRSPSSSGWNDWNDWTSRLRRRDGRGNNNSGWRDNRNWRQLTPRDGWNTNTNTNTNNGNNNKWLSFGFGQQQGARRWFRRDFNDSFSDRQPTGFNDATLPPRGGRFGGNNINNTNTGPYFPRAARTTWFDGQGTGYPSLAYGHLPASDFTGTAKEDFMGLTSTEEGGEDFSTWVPRKTIGSWLLMKKIESGITYAELAKATGRSEVFVATALLGQQHFNKGEAQALMECFGIDPKTPLGKRVLLALLLPARGAPLSPWDPAVYRLYELIQMYGPSIKQILNEKVGDCNFSATDAAVDFSLTKDKTRARITFDVAVVPYQRF